MKLLELDLQRSRGLDAPLVLAELGPGFNVVVGPNGSGKSSLCRGIAALLWETDDFQGAVEGRWEVDGATRDARRESGAPPRWTGEGAPAVPDAVYRGCFSFSVDDFLRETATEREMHQVIRTELSAGFDLLRVLARQRAARPGSTAVNKRRQELEGAGRAVLELREEHRGLWQKEQGLDELLASLQGASQALADRKLHELAMELAAKREELRQAAAGLEAFPPGMDRLRGDEFEKLEELRAACARLEEGLQREEERAAAASAQLEATGLHAPVPEGDLEQLAELGRELREREQVVERARAAEARAAAGIEESRRALRAHGAPTTGAAAGGADWPRLEQHLAEWQKLEARREELQAVVDTAQPESAKGGAAAPYEQALALLASWLESAGGVAAVRVRSAAWGVVALGAVAVLAAALGIANEPLSLALGLVLLGLGAWLALAPRGADRGAREREYAQLPVGPPTAWEAQAVARRLRELQAESAACRVRELDRLRAEEAAAKLERLAPRRAELERALHELALACGVSPESARIGIVAVAAERERLGRAERELAAAQADRNEARAGLARALARTGELLAAHGLAPIPDAAGLDAARGELSRREHARQTAEKDARDAAANARRQEEELERMRGALSRLAEERGLGELPEAELARRLDQLTAWREARERYRALEADVRSRAQQLEEHPDLTELELGEARRRCEQNAELAEKHGELQGEVAALEHAIGEARRGHGLEEALAEEAEARERLAESRDELFEAAAADFLVADVARDHGNLAQPDLLREVGRLFARFTRQRYELRAAASTTDGLPFEIHETDGEERSFAELSSGTRAQLGLALRIAVARSVEVGEALPLVLDEALTNSDPERFRDVVRSLAELVGEGRQVFFFTADDADAQRLEEVLAEEGLDEPRRFDLAALRGEARRAERVRTQRLPEVPAPGAQETAADYAERLGVPRLDPFAGIEALHPFYLAGDDLEGLHELLRERVDSVGRARALLADDRGLWSEERRARFEALQLAAAAWLDHYRIGRAPALQPEVLREGPAGRTKFVDALVDVNEELGRDAAALIEALELPAKQRDPRLKGFRKAILYELTGDLADRGLYSLDEPRSAEERVERCLEASRDAVARGVLGREEVRQLAHAFEQWAAAGA